jgi:hypothetical protein
LANLIFFWTISTSATKLDQTGKEKKRKEKKEEWLES